MSKVAEHKNHNHGGNNHKAHGGQAHKHHPAKKPPVKHVVHNHYTTTNNINITENAPAAPAPVNPTGAYPTYPNYDLTSVLGASQDLFSGFGSFLAGVASSRPAVGNATYLSFPGPCSFPSYQPYQLQTSSFAAPAAYAGNGAAGGWSAWGAARGY